MSRNSSDDCRECMICKEAPRRTWTCAHDTDYRPLPSSYAGSPARGVSAVQTWTLIFFGTGLWLSRKVSSRTLTVCGVRTWQGHAKGVWKIIEGTCRPRILIRVDGWPPAFTPYLPRKNMSATKPSLHRTSAEPPNRHLRAGMKLRCSVSALVE